VTIAYDLSAVLDTATIPRAAVIGKGGGQNIKDVRFLKGVDLGITSRICSATSSATTRSVRSGQDRLHRQAFMKSMHLVVRADSGIMSIEQLAGRRVNFSDWARARSFSTATFSSASDQGRELNMGQTTALEKLKIRRDRRRPVLIAGKPAGAMTRSAADVFSHSPDRLPEGAARRLPAGDADQRGLSRPDPPGQKVETVAVGAGY